MNIAIMGATSHMAKGLINNFLAAGDVCLHLFARSAAGLHDFLDGLGNVRPGNCTVHEGYKDFAGCKHDVIINCVGVGTANKLNGNYSGYFTVTEEFDNKAVGYLQEVNPACLYVSFSSGAVYGRTFPEPADDDTVNAIRVNHVVPEDYYAIARLNAETKHRALRELRIVDLRIFSYFSRFADLSEGYFITELVECALRKKVFVTDNTDIVRDYVNPGDLFSAVNRCIAAGQINAAFDITSSRPAGKMEIIGFFASQYGLHYEVGNTSGNASPTGSKNVYFSKCNSAAGIGYSPAFSSMDTIKLESAYILGGSGESCGSVRS